MKIDWAKVERILVVKLRSIGDTVLTTPSLFALRRFLPHAQIDILLEDWVAPVLDGSDLVDDVIAVGNRGLSRLRTARELRSRKYDVALNLHGGTTATFFTRASGARHRVGYSHYQYSFLYNHLLSSAKDFWQQEKVHSAEQQLALLGFIGVPVDDRPRSRLAVGEKGRTARVSEWQRRGAYALLHPGTAFFTKQWPAENFARAAEFLAAKGFSSVAVGSTDESKVLDTVRHAANVSITTLSDLTLPEITALASKASIFVGNDSGIAHSSCTQSKRFCLFSSHPPPRPPAAPPNQRVFLRFFSFPPPPFPRCRVFSKPKKSLPPRPRRFLPRLNAYFREADS